MNKNQYFSLYQGDDLNILVTVTDSNGNIIDLTGANIEWVLQPNINSTTALIKKSVGSGISITYPIQGQFTVSLYNLDTSNLTQGVYFHQARLTDSQGNKAIIMTGNMTVSQSASTF